jgi:hypothetical protein
VSQQPNKRNIKSNNVSQRSSSPQQVREDAAPTRRSSRTNKPSSKVLAATLASNAQVKKTSSTSRNSSPSAAQQRKPTLIPSTQTRHNMIKSRYQRVQVGRSAEIDEATAQSNDKSTNPIVQKFVEALAYFADWSNHIDDETECYYSMTENRFYTFDTTMRPTGKKTTKYFAVHQEGDGTFNEEAFRAVTKNVPKSFPEALKHQDWSEAAITEWQTILDAKTLVKVDPTLAKEAIKQGADMVILFPVYEEKEKEGKLIKKVRLVANGKTHHPDESTYAATPNREEFLVLLHLIAAWNLAWVHIDEKRAFLSAKYKGRKEVYTKHVHSNEWFRVLGALYGLKTSPKDYQTEVVQRLEEMGFSKLPTSNCIFIKIINANDFVIVYDYVDDFIVIGNSREVIEHHFINQFRQKAATTEPIWNPTAVLGMEVQRDHDHKIIMLTMTARIEDLAKFCHIDDTTRKREMPMPPAGYIIAEEDYQKLSANEQPFLPKDQIKNYMAIVGRLVWISGIRFDITFAVLYLSWHTKTPRQHHLTMAKYVAAYLYYTKDVPLVLGGSEQVHLTAYSDSSLATAPKRRSVSGQITKLHPNAGAVYAKPKTSQSTRTSSFESELDALSEALKTLMYLETVLKTLGIDQSYPSTIYADNKAMIDFVNGDGSLRNSRHMELRLWLVREQLARGGKQIQFMSGLQIPANFLTKLATKTEHVQFLNDIQGLQLLPHDMFHQKVPAHIHQCSKNDEPSEIQHTDSIQQDEEEL